MKTTSIFKSLWFRCGMALFQCFLLLLIPSCSREKEYVDIKDYAIITGDALLDPMYYIDGDVFEDALQDAKAKDKDGVLFPPGIYIVKIDSFHRFGFIAYEIKRDQGKE